MGEVGFDHSIGQPVAVVLVETVAVVLVETVAVAQVETVAVAQVETVAVGQVETPTSVLDAVADEASGFYETISIGRVERRVTCV